MTTANGGGNPDNSKKNEITLTLSKKCLVPALAIGLFILSFIGAAYTTGNSVHGEPTLWDLWRGLMVLASFVGGIILTIWSIAIIFDLETRR